MMKPGVAPHRRWIRSAAGRWCLRIVLVAVLALAVGCSAGTVETDAGDSTVPTISPDGSSPDTTSPADEPTTADATEPPPPPDPLVLRSDGLGAVAFGEPVDTALPPLIGAVGGGPSGDSTTTGVMPQGFGGTAVRFVEFGRLTVIFSDGGYFRDDGVMHFAGWSLSGPDSSGLATPEGITTGSTVDQLRAAFGDQLRLDSEPSECDGRWHFNVGSSSLGIEGVLGGPPTDGSSSVTTLGAGAQSTC